MTVAFLAGNLQSLLGDIFAAAQTADASVGRRLSGSEGHVFVVQIRVAATLLLWLLAGLGALRRYRWGNLDLEAVTLAAVPFGLMLFQAYGGEILLRVYLFSLPFVAYLVAGLFFPTPARAFSPSATRVLAVTLSVLLVVLYVTKHGNEQADYVSAAELTGLNELYAVAPVGSTLAAISSSSPMRYRNLEQYRYRLVPTEFLFGSADDVLARLGDDGSCRYLFLSHSQEATMSLFNGITTAEWQAAESGLTAGGDFQRIFGNADAAIYLATPAAEGCRVGG